MQLISQRLTYLEDRYSKKNPQQGTTIFSLYLCECGNTCIKRKSDVKRDRIKSCGNCNGHKMSKTRFYGIWKAMKTRCTNPNYNQYYLWGGRGIEVCMKWRTFPGFIDDMYESYKKHVREYGEKDTQLDRIDCDGHYEPSNCRWATIDEQASNKRNTFRFLDGDDYLTIPEYSRKTGIPTQTLYERYYHGNDLKTRHKPGPKPQA